MFGIGQERDNDPVIARLHWLLKQFVTQAEGILRDAGFDPDSVNKEVNKEVDTELSRRGHHQRRVTTSTYAVIPPGDGKLGDPTEPAFAARSMLWEARLMLKLMNEHGIDAVAVAHAFNLGRLVKHAELGMQFPEIAKVFQHRENRLINERLNKERHAPGNEARALVLSEWEQNKARFPSAAQAGSHFADWLEHQGYTFQPRTVTGWILKRAKEIGVKFR